MAKWPKVALLVWMVCLTLVAPALAQEKQPSAAAISAPIGLEVGEKAPAFSAPDQFGHQQSNETLKGPKGTILLFFRSADW
jgi:hypothetical protein